MDRLERNVVILQGEFIEELYDGLEIQSYLFKDLEYGWYSIKAVRGTMAHDQLKLREKCTVKLQVAGNLKTRGTKVNCYNELTLEVYKSEKIAEKR